MVRSIPWDDIPATYDKSRTKVAAPIPALPQEVVIEERNYYVDCREILRRIAFGAVVCLS